MFNRLKTFIKSKYCNRQIASRHNLLASYLSNPENKDLLDALVGFKQSVREIEASSKRVNTINQNVVKKRLIILDGSKK